RFQAALVPAKAMEGSIKWWSCRHQPYHRYTDTKLDLYNANRGLFYSHIA
ncbi:hypothetical protein BDQ17DRAFT_1260987, partial [Cyathus striatus]